MSLLANFATEATFSSTISLSFLAPEFCKFMILALMIYSIFSNIIRMMSYFCSSP